MDTELPRANLINEVNEFCDFFRRHMLLEETRFFPAANRLLNNTDWSKIYMPLETTNDPQFGKNSMESYQQLRNEIDEIAGESAVH